MQPRTKNRKKKLTAGEIQIKANLNNKKNKLPKKFILKKRRIVSGDFIFFILKMHSIFPLEYFVFIH